MGRNVKRLSDDFIKLLAVSSGHFINDFYMNLIPPILFIFVDELSLTLSQQGLLASVIVIGGSFAQPAVGYLVDKKGKPWLLIVSVLWIAVWMSISGLINNYYALILALTLASLASALYHPLGTATTVKLGKGSQGKSLSAFMTVGGLAASATPLVALPIARNYGLGSLIYFMFPGIIIAGLMYLAKVQNITLKKENPMNPITDVKIPGKCIKWVSVMIFISTNQELIRKLLITFGVQILLLKQISLTVSGIALSAYLFFNMAGTVVGGYLSDAIDNKKVILMFNLLTGLFIALLVLSPSTSLVILAFVMIGFTIGGSSTANIILTQELIPQRVNMATGLIMGFASGLAGLGILLFGTVAEHLGLLITTGLLLAPMILVNIVTLTIPNKQALADIVSKDTSVFNGK